MNSWSWALSTNKSINLFSEEIQDLKKQRPKKKDDEINPIWETLLKVIFDVTRLKGDIRNARLDKFLKEAQFDRKQSVCGKYRVIQPLAVKHLIYWMF